MLLKEIIGFILVLGILGTQAYEKSPESHEFSGESSDLMNHKSGEHEQKMKNHELHHDNKKFHKDYKKDVKYQYDKEYKKNWKNQNSKENKKEKKHQYEKNYKKDAKHQFEKDYKQWNKQMKHEYSQEKQNNFKPENKFDSNEYVDKYNRYGKTFDPNIVDKSYKKHKESYQEKHSLQSEKVKGLLQDTDVNYIQSSSEKPQSLLHDTDINHRRSNSEKPKSLLHDTDINYLDNHKKFESESELINVGHMNSYKTKEAYEKNYQNKDEVFEKRYKKNLLGNLKNIDLSSPPINDTVKLARFIVHSVDWASMATLTSRNNPSSLSPFACVKSMSDGEINLSSGIPFFYMSNLDLCAADLKKNNKVSLLITLSQTNYCKSKAYDPQDPRCPKVMMTGRMKWLEPETEEEKFAQKAMFSRHPIMRDWPIDHSWKFAKMDIDEILLLHRFGGATQINLNDYFNDQTSEAENAEVIIA